MPDRSSEGAKRQLRQSEHQLELTKRTHAADLAVAQKAVGRCVLDSGSEAAERLDKFVIRAPISGRVLSLSIPVSREAVREPTVW